MADEQKGPSFTWDDVRAVRLAADQYEKSAERYAAEHGLRSGTAHEHLKLAHHHRALAAKLAALLPPE